MKRSLIIFALLLFAITASAQQQGFWSPGVPPGSTSKTFTNRVITGATDSLNRLILGIDGNKFYDVITRSWLNSSNSFIRNGTSLQTANFNISGIGRIGDSLLVRGVTRSTGVIQSAANIARGTIIEDTLKAASNSALLIGLDINPGFNDNGHTSVRHMAVKASGSVSPGLDSAYTLGNIYVPGAVQYIWKNAYTYGVESPHNLTLKVDTGNIYLKGIPDTSAGYKSVVITADGRVQTAPYGGGGGITALTGDVTASGTGSVPATLATVNSNVGSFGDATHVGVFTVNGKGLITAASSTAITFPVTASNSVAFTNKTGNISQWTNDAGYLTGNQTISFAPTGDVTGSTTGTTTLAPALSIGAGKVTNAMLAGSIDLTSKVTGLLPVANGGTGTASPGIVAGTNIAVTGTWPNQTVNASGTSLTAGRGILLPSTAIILDTTQNYNWLKAQTITKNGIAVTPTDALNLLNTTASTSGVKDQYSPNLHFGGHTRNASADVFVDWQIDVKTINGSSPISYLDISASHSGTSTPSYTHLYTFDNSGNFSSTGNISVASGKSISGTSFSGSTATMSTNLQVPSIFTGTGNTLNLASATGLASGIYAVNINPNSNGSSITNSSGTAGALALNYTVNQTGTAATTGLLQNQIVTGAGSGEQLFADFQVNSVSKYKIKNDGTIQSQALTASKVVFTDASKNLTSTGIGTSSQIIAGDGSLVTGSLTQATADLTAQTSAGNITTFTVGASTATFNISAYLNITALSVDVAETQVTYTDENSTSQTANFYTQGATLPNISTTGNSQYPPMTIRAKNGTVITVKTVLTTSGGSITFDAGARISQL